MSATAEVDLFGYPVFNGERHDNDYYPTPITCIDPLLARLSLRDDMTVLEPCRGKARMVYDRVPLPPERKLWAEIDDGIDYLYAEFGHVDLIITNPPFSLALEFLTKSLQEADTVCYLLRLGFLGSQGRHNFWKDNPLTHLGVLSAKGRPSFTGDGTDNSEYGWFIWDRAGIVTEPPGVFVM
jgi:hypothetical protein